MNSRVGLAESGCERQESRRPIRRGGECIRRLALDHRARSGALDRRSSVRQLSGRSGWTSDPL